MEALFDCRGVGPGQVVQFMASGERILADGKRQVTRQAVAKPAAVHPTTPGQNVTDNTPITPKNLCFCGSIIPGKRIDRRYCSPKCRKQASRNSRQLAGVGR